MCFLFFLKKYFEKNFLALGIFSGYQSIVSLVLY